MRDNSRTATRNLVIVHTPECEAESDWIAVKEKIESRAPDIEVRIVNNLAPNSATRRWQVRRPSLVFSVNPLYGYRPEGGRIYAGWPLDKLAQFRRLTEAGVPMPRSVLLERGMHFDPAGWGEFVVVKPVGRGSSKGQFVQLVRTDTVNARLGELPRRMPMFAQQYVDSTDEHGCFYEYRVLTMFGRPMYQLKGKLLDPRPPLQEIVTDHGGEIAFNRKGLTRELTLVREDDVIDLARQAAAALSEFACLGSDIARDRATGQLYVLETNPGGFVWHLSSRATAKYPAEVRDGIYGQFNALETAAVALIERVREEAV